MKSLKELIIESEASEEAKKLGLISKPFGNYADKTGKLVAKSIDGKLHKIEQNNVKVIKDKKNKNTTYQINNSNGEFELVRKINKLEQTIAKSKNKKELYNIIKDDSKRRLINRLSKNNKENKFGIQFQTALDKNEQRNYKLSDNYSLKQSLKTNLFDKWNVVDTENNIVSYITIDKTKIIPAINWHYLDDKHRGKGLGRQSINKLVDNYDKLTSDNTGTQTKFDIAAWKSFNAKKLKLDKNNKARFILTKDMINEQRTDYDSEFAKLDDYQTFAVTKIGSLIKIRKDTSKKNSNKYVYVGNDLFNAKEMAKKCRKKNK